MLSIKPKETEDGDLNGVQQSNYTKIMKALGLKTSEKIS